MKTFSRRLLICALACFSTIALSAQAYVLPAEDVLEFMVKALGPARELAVTEQIALYPVPAVLSDSGRPGEEDLPAFPPLESQRPDALRPAQALESVPPPVKMKGTLSLRVPGLFREEMRNAQSSRLVVSTPDAIAKVENNYLIADFEDPFDLFKDPLLYRDVPQLITRLRLAGVRTEVCSLGFWEGRVAYVIGAPYPDESVPQFWIEKNAFLPIRFIVTRPAPGRSQESLEVHYDDWRAFSPDGETEIPSRYPGRIAHVRNGAVLSQRVLLDCAIHPVFAPDAFDAERMKKAYEPSPSLRKDFPGSQEMEGVRNAMEVFKKTTQ